MSSGNLAHIDSTSEPGAPLHLAMPEKLSHTLSTRGIQCHFVSRDPACPYANCDINPALKDADIVLLIVLQDSLGQAQFLLPADRLLDIRTLSEEQGRNWQALTPKALRALVLEQGFPPEHKELAAIPQCQNAPLFVCSSLQNRKVLYLSSGFPNTYLTITGDALSRYFENVNYTPSTVPVKALWSQLREDRGDTPLADAVKNFTALRIQQRLDRTLEIPPMPETARKIIKLWSDPNASVRQLAQIVERDPSLAAQVVSWASSPYYNAPGSIASVNDAVVRVLGYNLVINLALGLSLGKTLDMPNDGPFGIVPYWQQAVFTAALTEALVKRMDSNQRPSIGLAYLGGLLNNFGYLILAHVFKPFFSLISRFIEANPHHSHSVIEQYVLGVSREHICAWVMKQWEMPEEIILAMRWQHIPEYSGKHHRYAKLLFIANAMVQQIHTNEPHIAHDSPVMDPALLTQLQLNPTAVQEVLQNILEHQDELKSMVKTLEGN